MIFERPISPSKKPTKLLKPTVRLYFNFPLVICSNVSPAAEVRPTEVVMQANASIIANTIIPKYPNRPSANFTVSTPIGA